MSAAVAPARSVPRKGPRPKSPLTAVWESRRGNCPPKWAAQPVYFIRTIAKHLGQVAQLAIQNIIAIHLDETAGFPEWVAVTDEQLAEWTGAAQAEVVRLALMEVGGSVDRQVKRDEIRLIEWRPCTQKTGNRLNPDRRRKEYRVCFENFLAWGNRAAKNGDAKAKSDDSTPDSESKPQLKLGFRDPIDLTEPGQTRPIPVATGHVKELEFHRGTCPPVTICTEVHGAKVHIIINAFNPGMTSQSEPEPTEEPLVIHSAFKEFEKLCLQELLPIFASTPPASLLPEQFQRLEQVGTPLGLFAQRLRKRKLALQEWGGIRFIVDDVVKVAHHLKPSGNGPVPEPCESFEPEPEDPEAIKAESLRRARERLNR